MAAQKPPFRAEDMDGLFKKVVKGAFTKQPSHYSVDLNNMVKLFLKVNPQLRPNCDKILMAPPIQRRMDEKIQEADDEEALELLQTIKLPSNLHYLTDKLPKSNYQPIKTRMSCKPELLKPDLKDKHDMSQLDESMDSSVIRKSGKDLNSHAQNLPQIKGSTRQPQGSPIRTNRHRENELLKKQHQKIEAQLKKYNEILNNQKIKKDHSQKKKIDALLNNGAKGNSVEHSKNDYMKIYGVGVKRENSNLDSINKLPQQKIKKNKNSQGSKIGSLPRIY